VRLLENAKVEESAPAYSMSRLISQVD